MLSLRSLRSASVSATSHGIISVSVQLSHIQRLWTGARALTSSAVSAQLVFVCVYGGGRWTACIADGQAADWREVRGVQYKQVDQ